MNIRIIPILVATAALFASCSNDDTSVGGNEVLSTGADCNVAPIEFVDGMTRSSLKLGSSGMDFAWDEGDQLSIFYSESDQTASLYTLKRFNDENHSSANFKSDGFMLTNGKRYYAISTTESKAPAGVSIPDKRNIVLTYAGQVQKGNKDTRHLGNYAYMAASGIAVGDDHVDLDFLHLGLTIRVIMEGLPSNVEFTKMEMYDTENSYLQPLRGFDMTSGLAADGTYTPALKPVDINSAQYKAADRFSLKLEKNDDPTHGIKANLNVSDNKGRLEMFIELPPANLTGKDLIFMVYGSDSKAYYIKCDGRELKAGKAYQMKGTAQEATTYTVRVKVNHEWQLGNTITRATGDPGNDEKFGYPKNLYYILCVGGNVRALSPDAVKPAVAVTEIENIPTEDWAPSTDKTISTYTTPLTFNFDQSGDDTKQKHVYIVASNNDLTTLLSSISNNDEESKVQNLVYSIQEENLGSTFTAQDKTQAFMKNLYSTPWTDHASFVGTLDKDYFKDIILYHVAAKVDLKWNSATSVMGSTEETNKVKVNNVQSTNLSLFQPATVNGTTDHTGTNDYTVTSTIEEDRKFYGRQVFYLPQFASAAPNKSIYNVTIGNNTAENVDFTPVTTNGFTSWLRWLKNY